MFGFRILPRVALWLGATLLATPVRSADVLDTVRVANRLDLDASQSITASGAVPIPPAELDALLDPTRRPSDWKATVPKETGPNEARSNKAASEKATPERAVATAFHYRLAFKQPVELNAFTVEIDRGEARRFGRFISTRSGRDATARIYLVHRRSRVRPAPGFHTAFSRRRACSIDCSSIDCGSIRAR